MDFVTLISVDNITFKVSDYYAEKFEYIDTKIRTHIQLDINAEILNILLNYVETNTLAILNDKQLNEVKKAALHLKYKEFLDKYPITNKPFHRYFLNRLLEA